MGQPTRLKRRWFILRVMGNFSQAVLRDAFSFPFPHGPPGAVRAGFAERNLPTGLHRPVRPSGILSVTVVPTVILRSVPAFLPGSAERIPRPFGHVR
jgi:hypothetical protein